MAEGEKRIGGQREWETETFDGGQDDRTPHQSFELKADSTSVEIEVSRRAFKFQHSSEFPSCSIIGKYGSPTRPIWWWL